VASKKVTRTTRKPRTAKLQPSKLRRPNSDNKASSAKPASKERAVSVRRCSKTSGKNKVGASFLPPPLRASSRTARRTTGWTAARCPRRATRKRKPLGPRPWRASGWDAKGCSTEDSIGSIQENRLVSRLLRPQTKRSSWRARSPTCWPVLARRLANQFEQDNGQPHPACEGVGRFSVRHDLC